VSDAHEPYDPVYTYVIHNCVCLASDKMMDSVHPDVEYEILMSHRLVATMIALLDE